MEMQGVASHLDVVFFDNSAVRRRCGPIYPGEASAADAQKSIECERTPAAVIGRRREQLLALLPTGAREWMLHSSSAAYIFASLTFEAVAYT
jgi:hypothetical protein